MHPDTRFGRDWILTPRPWGQQYAAFKEVLTLDWQTGYVTGDEAEHLISRTIRRGWPIAADIQGVLRLSRPPRRTGFGSESRALLLQPTSKPHLITRHQYENLQHIEASGDRARLCRSAEGDLSIAAGFWVHIPPTAATILYRRGWITHPPHSDRLTISPAGRLAMAYHWHASRNLNCRLLKGLYLDAALTTSSLERR